MLAGGIYICCEQSSPAYSFVHVQNPTTLFSYNNFVNNTKNVSELSIYYFNERLSYQKKPDTRCTKYSVATIQVLSNDLGVSVF